MDRPHAAHFNICFVYGSISMSLLCFSFFLSHIFIIYSVLVDFWCPFNQPLILFGMRQGIYKRIASLAAPLSYNIEMRVRSTVYGLHWFLVINIFSSTYSQAIRLIIHSMVGISLGFWGCAFLLLPPLLLPPNLDNICFSGISVNMSPDTDLWAPPSVLGCASSGPE